MISKTKELRDLVAPAELEEVLSILKGKGDVIDYYVGINHTFIEASKEAEVELFLWEESRSVENSRPYIKNKQRKK